MITEEMVRLWFETKARNQNDLEFAAGMSVHELVATLRISKTSVHQLINVFDGDYPENPSEFPNAYKTATGGQTSPVVIPLCDVAGYMTRKLYGLPTPQREGDGWVDVFAGASEDEVLTAVAVWQEKFYGVSEACKELNYGKTKLYSLLGTGDFPHAYKPLGVTSRFRIPQRDIDAMRTANG